MSEILDRYPENIPETLEARFTLAQNGKKREVVVEEDDEEAFFKKVALRLKQTPRQKIIVIGHGDSRGTAQFNRYLAKQRAEFTKQQLITQGVPAAKILIRSAGKSQRRYIYDNTEAKKQKNRRADIYITAPVPVEEAAPVTEAKPENAAQPGVEGAGAPK